MCYVPRVLRTGVRARRGGARKMRQLMRVLRGMRRYARAHKMRAACEI